VGAGLGLTLHYQLVAFTTLGFSVRESSVAFPQNTDITGGLAAAEHALGPIVSIGDPLQVRRASCFTECYS
jgi:hypothetical protein